MHKVCVAILCFLPYITAFCFSHYGRADKTVTGRLVPVCEYNGLDILNGSHFFTAGCMSCVCNTGMLECCGFGVQDENNKVNVPIGCTVVADGCEPLVVKETDMSRDCYTDQAVTGNRNLVPIIPDLFPHMFQNGVPPGPLDFPAAPGTDSSPNAVNKHSNSRTTTPATVTNPMDEVLQLATDTLKLQALQQQQHHYTGDPFPLEGMLLFNGMFTRR